MYSVVLAAMMTAGPATPAGGYIVYPACGCYCYDPCCYYVPTVTYWHPPVACWGCYGCWGNCWGCGGCYSCFGCWGCWGGCWGVVYDVVPIVAVQPVVAVAPAVPVYPLKAAGVQPTQATVVVNLPADAVLYVDGRRSNLTSSHRTIVTPALDPAKEYSYTMRIEVLRDGKNVKQSKKVTFQAGKVVSVRFAAPRGGPRKDRPEEETAAALSVKETAGEDEAR